MQDPDELPSEDPPPFFCSPPDKVLVSSNGSNSSRTKVINDPIHGHIVLPEYVVQMVDTPQFQRLRDLKQLGTNYFVFPGASHNRHEHCIGVSHLAGKLLERFKQLQPELEITERELKLVRLGGLCHDLGHGPFSHAFEGWIRGIKKIDWHHEDMSVKMLQYMIDDNSLDYTKEDISFLADLIHGNQPTERGFLFEIISNSRNSIDVDKFDYLARDCYNLGIKSSYDSSRLMSFSRVINDEICFHSKEAYNVYGHRVSKAIEYMVSDALAAADPYMHISDMIHDPTQYINLSDSILRIIEISKQPELEKARAIIQSIRRRQLYKFADEVLVPRQRWEQVARLSEEELVTYTPQGLELQPRDIIIQIASANYAMKNSNPVDNVSLLIPDVFEEKIMRVYCRDREKRGAAQQAFRAFLTRDGGFPAQQLSRAYASPTKKVPLRIQTSPFSTPTRGTITPTSSQENVKRRAPDEATPLSPDDDVATQPQSQSGPCRKKPVALRVQPWKQ